MKQSRAYRGFTLIEVMISIVVLSISVLGFSAMTMGTIRGLSISDKLTTATTLAQTKMEELNNAPYADVIAENFPLEDYGAIAGYEKFRRSVTISAATPEMNTKTVTVNVWWHDDVGTTRNVNLSTLILQW